MNKIISSAIRISFFLLLVLLGKESYAQQPNLVWGKSVGGDQNESGSGLAEDQFGNTYICGSFRSVVNFGVSPNDALLTSNGDADIYFAKYDVNGNVVWARSIGSPDWDEGRAITVAKNGNVYITGFIRSSVDFDPGPGAAILNTNNGGPDIFIAAYNNQGEYLWAHVFGDSSLDIGQCIATDENSNAYLGGFFAGSVDFDPSAGQLLLGGAESSQDAFMAKFDQSGNIVWARNFGGNYSTNQVNRLKIDPLGNVYASGDLAGSVDFDPSPATKILTSNSETDGFMAKYDKDGNYIWAFSLGGNSLDRIIGFDLDKDYNLYISGLFSASVDFDPGAGAYNLNAKGTYDSFIAKYDSNGKFIWANSIGAPGERTYLYIAKVDKDGNFYGAGGFTGAVDFDGGPGTAIGSNLTSGFDVFLLKYDKDGKYVWHRAINGQSDYDFCYYMDIDNFDNICIIGNFNSVIDLDPTTCVYNVYNTNYSGDFFIAKYTQNNDDLANILNFSVPQQASPAVIDVDSKSVFLKVNPGTNLTALTPTITVPSCSQITPASGVQRDFSSPVTYTVTDKFNQQKVWTVTIMIDNLAQVSCSGQVTPILSMDLGTDSRPTGISGTTTYQFSPTNLVADSYAFYSSIPSHSSPGWLTGNDHTPGDQAGQMMIVNASDKSGEVLKWSVQGLCPNSIYRFSAWIANIVNKTNACLTDIPVNLTFEVRSNANKLLYRENTGDILSDKTLKWNEFGVSFTGQSEVVLIIRNSGNGTCGNDFAVDDISLGICGRIDLNSTIGVKNNEIIICEGSDVTIESTLISSFTTPEYQWQSSLDSVNWTNLAGATTNSFEIKNAAFTTGQFYRLLAGESGALTNPLSNCKIISYPVKFIVNKMPDVVIDNNGLLCQGSSTIIRLVSSKARGYQWFLNNSPVANANDDTLKVDAGGDYFLRAYHDDGCFKDSKIITITAVKKPKALFSFTNNCDGSYSFDNQSTIADNSLLTYQWDFGDPINVTGSILKNPTHTYSTPGLKKVLLTVFNGTGCNDTISHVINVLGATPKANINVVSQTPFCTDDVIKFANTSTAGFGAIDNKKWEVINEGGNVVYMASNTDLIEFKPLSSTTSQKFTVRLTVGIGAECFDTSNEIIEIYPKPTITFTAAFPKLCIEGNEYTLTEGKPSGNNGIYTGNGVQGNTFSPQIAGVGNHVISYTFIDQNGCSTSASQNLSVEAAPITKDKHYSLIKGANTTLALDIATPADNLKYEWSPATGLSNPRIANPTLNPTTDIMYNVSVSTPNGCISSCKISVSVLDMIKIPNVFTPNNDGKNDYWVISGLENYPNAHIWVYNRYGEMVYESIGYPKSWNGVFNNKPLPASTYYYVIKTGVNEISPMSGPVTILY